MTMCIFNVTYVEFQKIYGSTIDCMLSEFKVQFKNHQDKRITEECNLFSHWEFKCNDENF